MAVIAARATRLCVAAFHEKLATIVGICYCVPGGPRQLLLSYSCIDVVARCDPSVFRDWWALWSRIKCSIVVFLPFLSLIMIVKWTYGIDWIRVEWKAANLS